MRESRKKNTTPVVLSILAGNNDHASARDQNLFEDSVDSVSKQANP